ELHKLKFFLFLDIGKDIQGSFGSYGELRHGARSDVFSLKVCNQFSRWCKYVHTTSIVIPVRIPSLIPSNEPTILHSIPQRWIGLSMFVIISVVAVPIRRH